MRMVVDNLLLQSDMDQIETFLGTIWFNFAKLKEKFDDLSEQSDVGQLQEIKKIDQICTNLKNSIQICFNKMKKEQRIIKSVREAMRGEPIHLMTKPKEPIMDQENISSKNSAMNRDFLSFYENKENLSVQQ
jgi:hypothetical protein